MSINYKRRVDEIIISNDCNIREVIKNLNSSGLKISLVVDDKKKLVGTITDGDVRRGLLKGYNLDNKIKNIIHKKPKTLSKKTSKKKALTFMRENILQHMPVVNKINEPIGLYTTIDFERKSDRSNKIVIMTGGMGKRLLPLTKNKPKALVKVFDKPMLEHVVLKLKNYGFKNFIFSINYLGNMIKNYFSFGEKLNVKIKYIQENKPLGTAGSLFYLKYLKNETIMVTNCDIISDIDYGDALDYHIKNSADATIVVHRYETRNPFGVIKAKGNKFISYQEKPIKYENINAGIYVIGTKVLKYLKNEEYIDMPDFIARLSKKKRKVIVYPIYESWNDLGQKEENYK